MDSSPLRAGAVAYRPTPSGPRFLIVTSRNGTDWIFPKGHIEPGEEPPMTAIRELLEEAGVTGRVIAPLGLLTFDTDGGEIEVEYFLVEGLNEGSPQEGRRLRWVEFSEGRTLLSHADTRMLLVRAAERLGI